MNGPGEAFQLCGRRADQADQPEQRTQGECVPRMARSTYILNYILSEVFPEDFRDLVSLVMTS